MLPISKSYGHCYLILSSGICYLGTLVAVEYGSPGPPLWYYFILLPTKAYTGILVNEEDIDITNHYVLIGYPYYPNQQSYRYGFMPGNGD